MRVAAWALVAALLAALGVAASASGAAGAQPAFRVTFSGTAQGRFLDVERWILLSSGECYLRRTRDQKTALRWSVTLAGGRTLAAVGAATVSGSVGGTEVRDSCDDVAEELPPEAPPDWIRSLRCNDPLSPLRPARAAFRGGTLVVSAPVVAVSKKAVCTALPRSDELAVRLPAARVLSLRKGGVLRVPVGSDRPATGSYRPRANCVHAAKPYDGYRSFDDCVDTLRWSGMLVVTRVS